MAKSNLAYNFNLNTKEKVYKSPKKINHIGRVKKKKIAKVKPAFYIFSFLVVSCILSFYITHIVKGFELAHKIDAAKNQFKIQQSETVRLNSLLKSDCLNSAEIEKYAKLKLNMRKFNENQVQYVNIGKGNYSKNKNNKSKSNAKKNKSLLEKIKNCFNSIRN